MYKSILQKVEDWEQSFYDIGEKLKEIFEDKSNEKEGVLVPAEEVLSDTKDSNGISSRVTSASHSEIFSDFGFYPKLKKDKF